MDCRPRGWVCVHAHTVPPQPASHPLDLRLLAAHEKTAIGSNGSRSIAAKTAQASPSPPETPPASPDTPTPYSRLTVHFQSFYAYTQWSQVLKIRRSNCPRIRLILNIGNQCGLITYFCNNTNAFLSATTPANKYDVKQIVLIVWDGNTKNNKMSLVHSTPFIV